MGDYAKAELFLLETKTIWGKVLGREHPKYGVLLNNLGYLYIDKSTIPAFAIAAT